MSHARFRAILLSALLLAAIGAASGGTIDAERPSLPGGETIDAERPSLPSGDATTPDSPAPGSAPPLLRQTRAEADAKSAGCLSCHAGIEPMHSSKLVKLGCTDCHGGDAGVFAAGGSEDDAERRRSAHGVEPLYPEEWQRADGSGPSSANPERSYALLNRESKAYVRFVNPGDLRVAIETCGGCHESEVKRVKRSLMTTSSMLWGGAAYNNGIVGVKRYVFGESYSPDGLPQVLRTVPPPSEEERAKGILPFLLPLPPWNVAQPPDPFRTFERGGRIDRSIVSEVGNPNIGPFLDEPGRPDMKLGTRGLGTDLRISAGVLNLHKTRLNDPHLSFLGTNDHPGDYRSSGCTSCHVVYANDRDRTHSGPYAEFGHDGTYAGADPTIPRAEPGHPIAHRLTRAIPSSQCIVCHMHQPNSFVNTYLGYQLWDYEADGELLWPEKQRYPTVDEPTPFEAHEVQPIWASLHHNPEEAATRGLWTDAEFLEGVADLNDRTKETTFADYHGHGWIFRAVYKQDREGNLLDAEGNVVSPDDPEKFDKAVHLKDIHAEKGMHCVDCHFEQDSHGDGNLYGEYPDAIEIQCVDCHGTIGARADLSTSGPAAPRRGTDLRTGLTPWGERRFEWTGASLVQRSMLEKDLAWNVSQVADSIDPASDDYNAKARLAKTMQKDGKGWGKIPSDSGALAHGDDSMTCYTCHTSWMTSCFGCHLPQQANWREDMKHYRGGETRNWTSYNPQVVRHDVFMLAKHGDTKGNRVAPARSSSALVLSSVNANRERLYIQQPPVSAPGYSSQAFNAHFAHTVRKTETRTCDDCHVSENGDNNAWMAQVLTLGTNFVNFVGRYSWVAEGEHGVEAVAVTEWDEPQAVIGSHLHQMAYPSEYERHQAAGLELAEAHHHPGTDLVSTGGEALSLQLRGEYLYTANGADGLRVFDVANVDNKGFSERIVTAPVSPLGQRAYVRTTYATSVALPTSMPVHFGRERPAENDEQPMHPLYRYAYVADRYEGLVVVDVDMLADGDPRNNFIERAATFNPQGALDGASYVTIAGEHAYLLCRRGLVVVSIANPLEPRIVAELGAPHLEEPRAITVQFRYAFVTDARGLRVLDLTSIEAPRFVAGVDLPDAGDLYVARTYAYVPIGRQGLAIVDVERPESPRLVETYDAGGQMDDTRAVRIGATNGSVYAYVADGKNGLRVLQLISPGETPGSSGFSPRPTPRLIATRATHGPAIALSKGLDRDRAVDESGNQVSIFGRFGSRPFRKAEMERLYLRDGDVFTVSNEAPSEPLAFDRPATRRDVETEVQTGDPGEEAPVVQPRAPSPRRRLPGRR